MASAPLYDRLWTEPLRARLAEAIVELAGPPGRLTLLTGAALSTLAGALAEAGHRVVALGRQPRSAGAGDSTVTGSAVTWLSGDIGDLAPLRGGVDLVIAVNVVHAQPRPAASALRLAGLLAGGGRLICTGPGERAGAVRVASAERRTGLGWGRVCAHTAGRLTVEAIDALTAGRRNEALTLAVRAAADAYKLDVCWVEAPPADQLLAVLDHVPTFPPELLPGLPILRQLTGRGRATTGS
jgi:SAM-dependent methyltransferase